MADVRTELQKWMKENALDFDNWFDQLHKKKYGIVLGETFDPKYQWVTNEYLDPAYKVCQYWSDNDNSNDWEIFFGTEYEIIEQIEQYERDKKLLSVLGNNGKKYVPNMTNLPQIFVGFKERKIVNPVRGYRRDYPEFSLRLDKHETDLSKSDLKSLAEKILNIFKNFILEKGKVTVSYRGRPTLETWVLARTKEEGIKLFQALLSVVDQPVDRRKVFTSEPVFDEVAPKTQIRVLGEDYEIDDGKPLIEVEFYKSWVHLPISNKNVMLINQKEIVYADN